MINKHFLLPLIFLMIAFASNGQAAFNLPNKYVIHYCTDSIILDGLANENSWKATNWTDEFQDIEGVSKPDPTYQTKVKMLWDKTHLYVYAELEEPNIWTYYNTHDMIVYHENDFEIFIDPNRNTHNYYEIEINAQNTIFDLFMPKPYRNGGKADISWNAKDLKSAVFIDGSLNNYDNIDKKWSIEMAIPFSSLNKNGQWGQPEDGDIWKMNFSRVEWQTTTENNKYKRKKDLQTGKILPEYNWVWNPTGIINMHFPERWGLVLFADSTKNDKTSFDIPNDELLAKHLWQVYYKQKEYIKKHNEFAKSLSDFHISEYVEENGIAFNIDMIVNNQEFSATIKSKSKLILNINQDGLITKKVIDE